MFFFFSFLTAHPNCVSDKLQSTINVELVKTSYNRKTLGETKKSPIRTRFNYDLLDTNKDPMMCSQEGQLINWGLYRNVKCTKDDILTNEKKEALIGTMKNVESYIKKIFKVKPIEKPFNIQDSDLYYPSRKITVNDADLYIDIVARPYGNSQTFASAMYIQAEEDTKRPIQGVCFINVQKCSTAIENIDSKNSRFFFGCFHELMHAMGISDSNFANFHPVDSLTPFKNPTCTMKSYGIKRTYLVTPYAHKLAVNHFGLEKFEGDDGASCPSGIELENDLGPGTAGSHPEGRVYLSDVMCGTSLQPKNGEFTRVTDVTMAFLLDTGNYELDYTCFQPIIWGNGDSINGRPIKNFATGPPQKVFPDGYLLSDEDASKHFNFCSYDYKFLGHREILKESWNSLKPYIGEHQDFYNPNDEVYIGSLPTYDYISLKGPYNICSGPNRACLPGLFLEVGDEDGTLLAGMCHNYKIEENRIIFYTNDKMNQPIICNEKKQGKLFNVTQYIPQVTPGKYIPETSYYMCPNMERFKRTMKLYNSHFESDPFADKNPVPETPEPTNKDSNNDSLSNGESLEDSLSSVKTGIIISSIICAVLVIGLIVSSIYIYRKLKQGE